MIHHSLLKTKISKHPFYCNEDEKKLNYVTKLLSLYILKLKYKSLDVLFNVLYDSTKEEIDKFMIEFLPYDYIPLSMYNSNVKYIDIVLSRIINRLLHIIYYDTKMKRINDTNDEFIRVLNIYIEDKCNLLNVSKEVRDNVKSKVIEYINGVYNNDIKLMKDIYENIEIDFIGGIMEFIDNLKKVNEDKSLPILYNDFANQRFSMFISRCIQNIKDKINEPVSKPTLNHLVNNNIISNKIKNTDKRNIIDHYNNDNKEIISSSSSKNSNSNNDNENNEYDDNNNDYDDHYNDDDNYNNNDNYENESKNTNDTPNINSIKKVSILNKTTSKNK